MSEETMEPDSAQDVASDTDEKTSDPTAAEQEPVARQPGAHPQTAQESPVTAQIVRAPAAILITSDNEAYQGLNEGAAFFDLAPRHISTFTGEKAADALNGLVSNDVLPLSVGKGLYAAALTPKGKMLADVSILRVEPQTFLVETSESAGREWWAMIRKYVNPRLAKYKDESASYTTLAVYGPNAAAILARLGTGGLGDQTITDAMEHALRSWPDWAHAPFVLAGVHTRLVRAPHLGAVAGFEILAPAESRAEVLKNFARVGAVAGSDRVWRLAQLEGALPVLGLDMDSNTIPQEASLDDWRAISYEKGCYTGQETVARIHFRGHVNKLLRGLTSVESLPTGSPVQFNGKVVGEVRRAGNSPRLGPIAIAMLRREVPVGAEVLVDLGDTSSTATVVSLPFALTAKGADAKRGAS